MEVRHSQKLKYLEKNGRSKIIYYPDDICEYKWRYFILPENIYEHREYPVCRCGRKFVPKAGAKKKCWFCRKEDESKL